MGQTLTRDIPRKVLWLFAIALAGSFVAGASPAPAASPLSWATPFHADSQPPFDSPTAITGVSCPSTGLCIAVDGDGDVLSSTDPTGGAGAWVRDSVANDFSGVSCPSTELCVAVGGGDIVTSTAPAGGAGAWTVTSVLPPGFGYGGEGGRLEAVSCASVSLCVVTETGGDVLTSTDPTGGAGAWSEAHVDEHGEALLSGVSCPSAKLCVAVDREYGDVVTSTDPTGGAGAWSVTSVDPNTLFDVSCSSENLCVATANDGNLITSTNPTGGAGAWTSVHVSAGSIDHVSCASWGFCIALTGNEAIASTEPTGGVQAWTSTPIETVNGFGSYESLDGVSCPAASLCVLADSGSGVVTSTEPTGGSGAWTVTHVEVGSSAFTGVSCASGELCVAVDDIGKAVISTDPAGGVGAWRGFDVDDHGLDGVSCPSSGLCVAVDEAGDVVASTDPAGGSGAWHVADVDGTTPLAGVACPSVGLCVAFDREDRVLTSTDPAGGAGTWTTVQIAGGGSLSSISCPSEELCFLTGEDGLIASTDPTGGAGAWHASTEHVDGSISCPSVALCVAVSGYSAATSTDPTGGESAWTSAYLGGEGPSPQIDGLGEVSCAPSGLCVATTGTGTGSPGNVMVSTEPTGGAPAWIEGNVYGVALRPPVPILPLETLDLTGVSCTESLCAVIDAHGRVMVGAPPPAVTPVNPPPPVAPVTSPPSPQAPGGSAGSGGNGGSAGGGGGGGSSTPTGAVSGAFVLDGIESVAAHSTVDITLTLPGPGTLQIVARANAAQLAGASHTGKRRKTTVVIARRRLTVSRAGRIAVALVPTGSAARALTEWGKLMASVTITYTPTGGEPRSIVRTVTFRSKRPR